MSREFTRTEKLLIIGGLCIAGWVIVILTLYRVYQLLRWVFGW